MKTNRNKKKNQRKKKLLWLSMILTGAAMLGTVCLLVFLFAGANPKEAQEEQNTNIRKEPDALLLAYMELAAQKEYEKMYDMLDVKTSGAVTKEAFLERYSAIYEGIQMQNMTTAVLNYDTENEIVSYETSFDTAAGVVHFDNEACFQKDGDGYQLIWSDSLIFPKLWKTDKVRVSVIQAQRGDILDRKGRVLAGWGTAASVGVVPGKLKNSGQALKKIAALLEMELEAVEKKLDAGWVKADSFVPLRTVPGVKEVDLLSMEPDAAILREKERQEELLQIPGVMITETKVREYPYGNAAAHLVGYVQNVTAEDLEEHAGEGYTAGSMIGRSGIEGLYEKELKGTDGCRIYITDESGKEIQELARKEVQHGQDIKLTIDAALQVQLYEQFQEDKSCSVAMEPYTGEVLALTSTPSYDNNDFIMGMSQEQWDLLNEDEKKPMYNRFRQVWCPGSTFKPVIAAIGLETGRLDPEEDFGNVGRSWQKDASWGGYYVTTLHDYQPVIMDNALIWSDNIYFAKAALKIGADNLEKYLLKLDFTKKIPFEITMAQAQFSNTEHIDTEIQLADSGYGQGQILINPLHLAGIYSAFCNEGTMVRPYITRRSDTEAGAEDWIGEAFSPDTAERVLAGLKKVVNDPDGTGYALHRDDMVLAGKTGTAEIKASKEDSTGTELGWMVIFTTDKDTQRPILLVSMTEDVKGRGGSGYVVQKVKQVLDDWFEEDGSLS